MYNTSFFKKILLVASVVLLYSCDKDFNVIGDDLIGDNHFDLAIYNSNVVAYNQQITPIQSNNLNINQLGIYDNSAFGITTASFATQLTLANMAPVIGASPVADSIVLSVPYFSHITSQNADGSTTYKLDSIYGPDFSKIKLSIYESGYYMADLDPSNNFQNKQLFYTNQNSDFYNAKGPSRLNNASNPLNNEAFVFSPNEIRESTSDATGKITVTRSAPAMRLKLDKTYFEDRILKTSASNLATNDVFKNYFRGLYFNVDKSGSDAGNMAMMDFKKGKITIYYKAKTAITTDAEETMESKTLVLNLTGNTVNLLNQSNTNTNYNTAITTPKATGDDKLYLKGGEGSMAILELFAPGELEEIRSKGWLINEANLVFNIDSDAMKNSSEPNRIYLYDFKNNRPIVDYYNDGTPSANGDVKKTKQIFSGIINVDPTSKRGTTYKIRITNHIRNLIKYKDSTNVKMGIVVTEDINTITSNKLRTPGKTTARGEIPFTAAPRASVMSPLGTILFGSTPAVTDDKRLKLQIYYTKPN
ncbi:DUF4270 domain-containing protein [Flavobacterium hydatis]|uniref:DUF4270 domain-containing protein n=1 Tax=Flavobacterium hydatis TaxID=991 RepID=A0A086AF73_FLAHY|nr:DUF4270 domain-containing protein [Flavobacterium hydatis]KFF15337.1 hypothetical protein IW20_14440 [Flavobacterium hydatis]OXA98257.1 hypothetical protein B0A62_00190 [Flavobacterium hydatis]